MTDTNSPDPRIATVENVLRSYAESPGRTDSGTLAAAIVGALPDDETDTPPAAGAELIVDITPEAAPAAPANGDTGSESVQPEVTGQPASA